MAFKLPPLTGRIRYLDVVDALAAYITDGGLVPGTRLPSQRSLAEQLGISIATANRAYMEAARRGLIVTHVGRGTFVVSSKSAAASEDGGTGNCIDLTTNQITFEDRSAPYLQRAVETIASQGHLRALMRYQAGILHPRYQEAGSQWLSKVGVTADPANVMVCNGLQHGVSLVLSAFARPGDVLLTEELGFPGFRLLEYTHPIEVRGIAIDGQGLRPDSLNDACRKSAARFLLYTPFVHNPTNAVASVDRRKQIAEVAERHNLMIIECDNNEIPLAHPMRPISELVPSRSIYVSTAWRATGFGICVGFMHAPKEFISQLTSALQATTWMLSPLQLEIFRQWLDNGTIQRILGWHRQENARRLKVAHSLLGRHQWRAHETSPHIWLPLPEPWRYEDFTRHTAQEGVLVLSADEFAIGRSPVPHAVRISLGGVRDINVLESALKKLDTILSGQPPLRRAVV